MNNNQNNGLYNDYNQIGQQNMNQNNNQVPSNNQLNNNQQVNYNQVPNYNQTTINNQVTNNNQLNSNQQVNYNQAPVYTQVEDPNQMQTTKGKKVYKIAALILGILIIVSVGGFALVYTGVIKIDQITPESMLLNVGNIGVKKGKE